MSAINVAAAVERARQEMIDTYGKEEVMFPHDLEAYGIHGTAWYTLTPLDLMTEEEREAYYAEMEAENLRQVAEDYDRQQQEEADNCPLCWKPLAGELHFHLECARAETSSADFEGEGNEPDNDDPIQSIECLR